MSLSPTGAELLFEIFSQRYERGSTIVTSNLPFDEWTSVFGSERLTGALLDRLTHHVHILEMNGDSYRLNQSKRRSRRNNADTHKDDLTQRDAHQTSPCSTAFSSVSLMHLCSGKRCNLAPALTRLASNPGHRPAAAASSAGTPPRWLPRPASAPCSSVPSDP